MSPRRQDHWRSLAQLADDPDARAFLEREFPEHASELPAGVSRRTMLTLIGASLSLAGLAACRRPVQEIVPYVKAPEEVLPGVPLRYATTLPQAHSAFGLVVESHEGRPTKIEGNELHPSTAGASSSAIQASILGLYDPDRSRAILEGDQTRSWDELVQAWSELEPSFAADGGASLAVLTEPFSSPTLARLSAAFRSRFPAARWVAWEPVSDETIHAGARTATGADVQPLYHLDRASVVLSLESDLLLTESESIRHARGFADGRRIASASDTMNRLYAVESALSLTGGNADHRLRLPGSQVGALLAQLIHELGRQGLDLAGAAPAQAVTDEAARFVRAVASDLFAARGRGLIVAGRRQPAEVHAAVFALNAALGNVGATVTYRELKDAAPSRADALADLVGAMTAGSVRCLIVLGANPVYAAPVDLDFAGAMERVEQVIHLGTHRDETAARAAWHIPQAHFLEAWGDARAADGTPSVVQPLIAPLFGGVAAVELLGLVATGAAATGYDLVRDTWAGMLEGSELEPRWNRVLHDGLLADGGLPDVSPVSPGTEIADLLRSVRGVGPIDEGDLEIAFQPSPSVFDGRHANNGWLQELPHPVTKLTWDNAALLSPATAAALGLANEDLARVVFDGREVEAPVWIVPGQADRTVGIELGFGRHGVGRIADGCGFNGYALRTAAAASFGRGVTVAAAGGKYKLAQTQDHGSMEGRPLVREATLADYRRNPRFAKEAVEHPPLISLWEGPPGAEERSTGHRYDEGFQWAMTIDLNACTGCNACVTACQSENNIPVVGKAQVYEGREMHWIRVDRYFAGDVEAPETVFQPVPCMHCENAPCEQVCPVAATVHDSEGLNTMVYNRCIGTRYCANNCPYKVRRFNFFNFTKDTPEVQKMAHNPDVTVRSRGVMEKCTYCTQRINAAKIEAKLDGRELADGDFQTACQQACPTRAIAFGNVRDPRSEVARMKGIEREYVMIAELNNRPRTSYLAKLRNPHPDLGPVSDDAAEEHHG